jgi:uncharacterized protein YcgL (UPF0745 family)
VRLRIGKALRGGEYLVSFKTVDFSLEEQEKIEKFGSPEIDFSLDGLGTRKLENLDVSVKCESPEKAEEFILQTKDKIKERLAQLKDMVDTFSGEEDISL